MRRFSITWDYRCPFARNAAEHVMVGILSDAEWDVTWVPFSLNQAHVDEGGIPVWEDPLQLPNLRAMLAGITVMERWPAAFPSVHMALFAARHDEARDLRDQAVVDDVLRGAGVDLAEVHAEIEAGWPLQRFREMHEAAVARDKVFGVPTFIVDDQSVFVRLMHRPKGEVDVAVPTVERVLDLVTGFPELNEFKHTSIPR